MAKGHTWEASAALPYCSTLLQRHLWRPSMVMCRAKQPKKGFGNSNKTLSADDDDIGGLKRRMKRKNIKPSLQVKLDCDS